MSFEALLSRTATVRSKAQTGPLDTHGNAGWVESELASPAYLEQTNATEITVGRETLIADGFIVLPAGTAVDGNDEIDVDGDTYIVVGPPARIFSARTGTEHHVECEVRKVVG